MKSCTEATPALIWFPSMSAIMGALPRYGAETRSSWYFCPISLTRNSGVDAGAGMPTAPLPPPEALTQPTYSVKDLAGVPPDTANAFTNVAKPPTATKSRAGS